MKRLFWAVLLAIALSASALAGAWGREAGSFLLAPKNYRYQATKCWDNNSKEQDIGATYDKNEVNVYFEYGLGNNRTLLAQTAWDHITSGSQEVEGLADLEIGLIQRLRENGREVLSGKAILIIPAGYPTHKTPLIGYGKYGAELGVLLGRSFDNGYLDSGLSYRYYDGYPSDQLRGNFTLGYDLTKKIRTRGELSAIFGLGNGQSIMANESIIPPDYQLLQLDLSLEIKLNPGLSLLIGYNQAILGRNTGAGRTVYFGCDLKN